MKQSMYTEAFKQNALAKVYQRQGCTIQTIADELNLNKSTLKGWMQTSKRQQKKGLILSTTTAKRPDDWTLEARLLALHQSHGLADEALSAWCRQQGIFAHHLQQWRDDFCLNSKSIATSETHELRTLKQKNHNLERDIRRKDKALAEAAALLLLQKKFNAFLEAEEK